MNISLRKFGLALALVTLFGISAPAQVRIATVDLNRVYRDAYLGDMHGRRMKELRLDVKQPTPGLVR